MQHGPSRGSLLAVAVVMGLGVVVAGLLVGPTLGSNTAVSTTTATTTEDTSSAQAQATDSACQPASALSLETFDVNVQYSGRWNATATVFADSVLTPAFVMCYVGDGPGSISVSGWDQHGGHLLRVTVMKLDAGGGNLTATTADDQTNSTTAPDGAVTVSETAMGAPPSG